MLKISEKGHVDDARIRLAIRPQIERGPLHRVRGLIVHQTGGATAASTLDAYRHAGNGAHFLIDKDGTVYQTASVRRRCAHVGRLRARCVAEGRCTPGEAQALQAMSPAIRHQYEMRKQVPDRYPCNEDSLGIELVGQALPLDEPDPDRRTYEPVSAEQNIALRWLVMALRAHFDLPASEVFRHPQVSQKNATEAASASW
ncbi:peptidoglycan recognition protein family protein [Eleftheria terrae]|uniref:peptidoglycan recognition protein family protein n=1 Tax=Eleftheria terrae TaxID=1597781 RepID=UPI00263AE4B9|nr:peptidoglycan recognition family protein [Eleftheria terrae]WKB52599.1 N-acetylmuramoyl-L-alanine amidase [Eleftheria terrae]